jgi:Sulfotransferase domain
LMRIRVLAGKLGSSMQRKEGSALDGGNEESGQDQKAVREKLVKKNERLRKLREQLEKKDRELDRLRAQQAQSAARGVNPSFERTPVFFVVGRAKSGTSWVMKILDAHPEILCKGEGRFFGRSFIQEGFERGRIQPSSLYRALLEAEYLEAWIERSVWTRGDEVEEHLINLTRLSTNYFLSQRLAKSAKRIVGDKTPLLDDDILEEISAIYPEARVIHVIRDGRDIAVSLVHHRWNHARDEGGIYELKSEELAKRQAYRENSEELIKAGEGMFPEGMLRNLAIGWKDRINKSMQDGRSLLGANYTEVRYEDLLERPDEEVQRLLEFLGADASEKFVKECVESASFEKLSRGRKRGEEDSASFFRKGVAGDWRNVFTEADKRAFKEAAGVLLVELGYEKDYNW